MEQALTIAGMLLVVVGLLFMLFGSVGLISLPDFFSRTHATSTVDTVGSALVLLGIAVMDGFTLNGGKLLVAVAFVVLTNPVAGHALARAALSSGQRPWVRDGQEATGEATVATGAEPGAEAGAEPGAERD